LSPRSFEVDVPGGRLAVFELSQGAPGAPVVLAAHGITGNSHSWTAVARALRDRARLLAVDLRGRGDSRAVPGPYGLRAHADDLIAVLDAEGIERAVIAGHSLGAYIVARLAADDPQRAGAVVLVDGGLRIPGSEGVDPEAFTNAFLGLTLARLQMRFESEQAYEAWWREHPAIAGSDVSDDDLAAYARHDLVGETPELRSSVSEDAVRADATDLFQQDEASARLAVPATLLCAPFGLRGEPSPMQPIELAEAWAANDPDRRRAVLVPDVNHYTITLGGAGARAVAGALLEAAGAPASR
jgi:pimeloyl-ACP methyl ester carboxylesterase